MWAGLTGHQRIGGPKLVTWLREQFRATVRDNDIRGGVTSLAIGADQLFASVLLEMKVPYLAVLPCKRYEDTFSARDRRKYLFFLRHASRTEVLSFEEPSEYAFYEAGKVVVLRSDFLIAVWDGLPAKGLGGTADIVAYARSQKRRLVHINPEALSVTLCNHD